MITLLQVSKEMAQIKATNWGELKPGQKTRLKARLAFLGVVKNYLDTAPEEDFIKTEKKKMEKLVAAIDGRFGAWVETNKQDFPTLQDQKKGFEKEYNLKKLRSQIKALSFILNAKTNEIIDS